ncbi:HAD family hydrolase [Galactobacter valiniphilus]|uniref:HAD family hydrolase n=1 Tax=Galactobacter valiniphilus TaxID=2676122 RepID=UPI00373587F2
MQQPSSTALPQAVLWDMDGTLIDSEPLWMGGEIELMARHGLEWTHEDALQMVGMALPDGAAVLQRAGLALENREIVDTLITHVLSGLRTAVEWRPGARELLLELHAAGVPQALVTMSETPLAEALIEGLPFNPFDAVVTGDTVTRGKPDPEPYARGLELLSVKHGPLDPARSVAVEDSRPGTASALAAGLVTLGVPFMQGLPRLAELPLLDSLEGVSAADLGRIVDEQAARRSLL